MTDAALGINKASAETDYIAQEVEELLKLKDTLMSAKGEFGADADGNLDKTITQLQDKLMSLRVDYLLSGGKEESWEKLVNNIKDTTDALQDQKSVWEELTESVAAYFTQLGFTNDISQMFAESIVDIAKTQIPNSLVSGFDAIGKALAEGADAGDAIKKNFAQFISQVMKSMSVTCIQAGVSLIAQSGWAGVPAALALFALGGASGIASGFVSSLTDSSANNEHVKQVKDLTDSYKRLAEAIKEQEEYYIKKKAELNMIGLADKVTKVNDMILTPHGTFSTSPQDTIIATKNPQGLGGGVVNNIKVINNAGVDVNVRENKGTNMNEILVTISKKIASDVAGGLNGWDGAFAMQRQRVEGRRI